MQDYSLNAAGSSLGAVCPGWPGAGGAGAIVPSDWRAVTRSSYRLVFRDACLMHALCLRQEYINCTLWSSGGVFYQLFSLPPSISHLSVDSHFLLLIFLKEMRVHCSRISLLTPCCSRSVLCSGGSTVSLRSAVELRPSSKRRHRDMFDLGPRMC